MLLSNPHQLSGFEHIRGQWFWKNGSAENHSRNLLTQLRTYNNLEKSAVEVGKLGRVQSNWL